MTATSAPTLTVDVDPTNPGQILACCGLFELAACLDDRATAWFDASRFHIHAPEQDPLPNLLACTLTPTAAAAPVLDDDEEAKEDKSPPVTLGVPFGFKLDWWREQSAKVAFKTWAGGQTVMGFLEELRRHLQRQGGHLSGLFDSRPVDDPKPFYYDCRLARLTSLDMGFSAEKFTPSFSPAVELLAFIGLQRFRPAVVEPRERYEISTWRDPLPVMIAAAVAHGVIPSLSDRVWSFPLVVRTGGKYKAFGPAKLKRSING